jgi:hypothetical protein
MKGSSGIVKVGTAGVKLGEMAGMMPGGGTGLVGFRDQVLCTCYTAGGDSGSAVLNMSKKVVGLHFAASPSTSIFNPIKFTQAALKIEIVTDRI